MLHKPEWQKHRLFAGCFAALERLNGFACLVGWLGAVLLFALLFLWAFEQKYSFEHQFLSAAQSFFATLLVSYLLCFFLPSFRPVVLLPSEALFSALAVVLLTQVLLYLLPGYERFERIVLVQGSSLYFVLMTK